LSAVAGVQLCTGSSAAESGIREHHERITTQHHVDLGEYRRGLVDKRGGNGDAAATARDAQRVEAQDCDQAAHQDEATLKGDLGVSWTMRRGAQFPLDHGATTAPKDAFEPNKSKKRGN